MDLFEGLEFLALEESALPLLVSHSAGSVHFLLKDHSDQVDSFDFSLECKMIRTFGDQSNDVHHKLVVPDHPVLIHILLVGIDLIQITAQLHKFIKLLLNHLVGLLSLY